MARATSSFPVPLSPVMSTRLDCGAMVSIKSKRSRILGLAPMMRSKLATQFAGFLAQSLIFGDAFDGRAKFIEQAVALDDVAIGAEVYGINGGVHGRDARNKDENGVGRNFFRVLQKLDAVHIRHGNIGDDDVEDLRGQASLGGLAVRDNFDFVPFLAEADFQ